MIHPFPSNFCKIGYSSVRRIKTFAEKREKMYRAAAFKDQRRPFYVVGKATATQAEDFQVSDVSKNSDLVDSEQ